MYSLDVVLLQARGIVKTKGEKAVQEIGHQQAKANLETKLSIRADRQIIFERPAKMSVLPHRDSLRNRGRIVEVQH